MRAWSSKPRRTRGAISAGTAGLHRWRRLSWRSTTSRLDAVARDDAAVDAEVLVDHPLDREVLRVVNPPSPPDDGRGCLHRAVALLPRAGEKSFLSVAAAPAPRA